MKKEETMYVKVDSRNRITIPKKLTHRMSQLYKVYEKDGKIILEPVHEVSKDEQWLLDPKNKAILARLKEESLKEQHQQPKSNTMGHQQGSQQQHGQQQEQNAHNAQQNQIKKPQE